MGFRARLKHVVIGGVASGTVACATILGINDRTLDTQGSDATTDSGADGAGGAAGDASADVSMDQTVPTDVSSGDAAVADSLTGDAGSSGDTSRVADGPTIDVGTIDAPTADALAADAQVDAGAITCLTPCTLATGLNHPQVMTSDNTRVYWSEFGDDLGVGNGYVKSCPLDGCGAGPLVYALGLTNPLGVAVDSTDIYFGATGAIYTCPLGGCAAGPRMVTTAGRPYGVAVDATNVYWVDDADNTVHRVAKTGGANQVLYDAGDGLVYDPYQCVIDGPFLYFMDYNEDAYRISVGGGPLLWLGTGYNNGQYGKGFGITTDTASAYFGGDHLVLRADKATSDSGTPIATTVPRASGLVYDPTSKMLYWANLGSYNGNDGTVGKMGTDGSGAQVLVASLATPIAVTISGSYVYWLSFGALDDAGYTLPSTGALFRRAK